MTGEFTVHEYVWDSATQTVKRFAATFEQHADGSAAALTGIIQYHSLYGVDVGGVLANDRDVDGDSLRSTLRSGPSHGTVELDDSGGPSTRPTPTSAASITSPTLPPTVTGQQRCDGDNHGSRSQRRASRH